MTIEITEMGRFGVIRRIIETEEDVAWETRRLAQRIHRLLNPELFPDEPPTPAVCAIDSLRDLPEYPVGRRRIGTPGPPEEAFPPPPGMARPLYQAPSSPPPRMQTLRVPGRLIRIRPPPVMLARDDALPSISESSAPGIMNQSDTDNVPSSPSGLRNL